MDLVDDDVRDVRQRREVELGVDLVLFCPSLASSPPAPSSAPALPATAAEQLPQQHARRAKGQPRPCGANLAVEPHAVAHHLAHGLAALRGDARSQPQRRDPPGLRDQHVDAAAPPGPHGLLEQELGDLRRLAAPGLPGDHDDAVPGHRVEDRGAEGGDGQGGAGPGHRPGLGQERGRHGASAAAGGRGSKRRGLGGEPGGLCSDRRGGGPPVRMLRLSTLLMWLLLLLLLSRRRRSLLVQQGLG